MSSTMLLVIAGGVVILVAALIFSLVVERYQQRASAQLEKEAGTPGAGQSVPAVPVRKPVKKAS